MSRTLDYYKVLGITPSASDGDIRNAYRKLLHELHPGNYVGDPAWALQRTIEINEAYETLGFPKKRSKYDQKFSVHLKRTSAFSGGTGHTTQSSSRRTASASSRPKRRWAAAAAALVAVGGVIVSQVVNSVHQQQSTQQAGSSGTPRTSALTATSQVGTPAPNTPPQASANVPQINADKQSDAVTTNNTRTADTQTGYPLAKDAYPVTDAKLNENGEILMLGEDDPSHEWSPNPLWKDCKNITSSSANEKIFVCHTVWNTPGRNYLAPGTYEVHMNMWNVIARNPSSPEDPQVVKNIQTFMRKPSDASEAKFGTVTHSVKFYPYLNQEVSTPPHTKLAEVDLTRPDILGQNFGVLVARCTDQYCETVVHVPDHNGKPYSYGLVSRSDIDSLTDIQLVQDTPSLSNLIDLLLPPKRPTQTSEKANDIKSSGPTG